MIKNYFKIAFRNLARNKTYSLINILGLTLGIISCLTIYLVTSFELGFDKFHPGRKEIYRLGSEVQLPSGEKEKLAMGPDPATPAIRKGLTGIEKHTAFHVVYPSVSGSTRNNIEKFYRPGQGRD